MVKNRVLAFNLGRLAAGGFVLLLSACAAVTIPQDVRYSRVAMGHLYGQGLWSFEGRLALTGKNDAWSANINWEHTPYAEKIKLSGPLGQGAMVISLVGDVVTLDRGGGDVQSSTQPEEFINQQLGMFVPVGSLRYWVVGLPEPSSPYKDTDLGFSQAGWINEYKQMQLVDNHSMPYKMAVMNNLVKLKLIIDHWVINDTESN
jgi:outer membrane lipoprotein LolB